MSNFCDEITKKIDKSQVSNICNRTKNFKHFADDFVRIYLDLTSIIPEVIKRNTYLLECFIDKIWESLNTGHWKDVENSIKELYSLGNLLKAAYLLKSPGNYIRALYALDHGILLGGPIHNSENILQIIAKSIHKLLPKAEKKLPPLIRTKVGKPSTYDIKTRHSQSIQRFNEDFFIPKIPVVLKGCLEGWPALEKWNDLNYLIEIAGYRLVPIEIGKNYTKENWSQKLMLFRDFLLEQFNEKQSHSDGQIKYLAQHNLFDQIVELREDICVPDYCGLSDELREEEDNDEIDVKAWFGPKNTVSPMHYDVKNNLLCQVVGQKKVILAAPEDTPNLYAHENFMLENTSQIDCEAVDFVRFPLVKKCHFYEFILSEGEMVYIPPRWWHHIRSLSNSFSVSFWWE